MPVRCYSCGRQVLKIPKAGERYCCSRMRLGEMPKIPRETQTKNEEPKEVSK
jgi:DNA-directed RNA polymerase subunit N (RpoN/RPB10)